MRDLEHELGEVDGVWPDSWRPKEGETLVGKILRYSTGNGAYGPVRTAILQKDNGEKVSVWISSTVLLSLFEKEKPAEGERVGIKYSGKHPTKGYKLFALVVDREKKQPDFSPLGGEQDPFRDE